METFFKLSNAVLLTFCLSLPLSSAAQTQTEHSDRSFRLGLTGGANYIQLENYGGGMYAYFDYKPGWQAGIAAQYKWGGFLTYSIQPELRFQMSDTEISPVLGPDLGDLRLGALELPVNFQFGPQLSKIFRPFVQAGVNFSCLLSKNGEWTEYFDSWSMFNRFNAGLNAGIGFDLWRFQFQCNYRWNLTNVNRDKELFDRMKIKGFEFNFGVFF